MAVADESELYGVSRDRFVVERNALARALRADGRRDDAQRVAKLAKPTLAVWTVNQLARRDSDAIDELFAAGQQLDDAQRELLAGDGDRETLRAAGQRERDAVDALVTAARTVIGDAGDPASPATLGRIADTLHAAALEPEVQLIVRDGRLDRELRHVGLGDVAERAQPGDRPRTGRGAGRTSRADTQQRDRQRQAEREREAARLEALRKAESEARHAAEQAADDVRRAEEARDRAAAALDDADHTLAAARERAQVAAEHHRSLQQLAAAG
ncbi:MAG: hypothetical protein WAL22_04095 [Solirubrobacteraceae bacterium]